MWHLAGRRAGSEDRDGWCQRRWLVCLAAAGAGAGSSAFRPTAPQVVQPHAIYARGYQLLRDRLPDVYQALLAAGVVEAPLWTQMPGSLADTAARPGDEQLTALMTRRSTVDWVLQRTALAEPGVTVRCGVRVTGLSAVPGQRPHMTGVRTDREACAADLVIDATGRRSPIDRWLAEIGAQPTATWRAECGLAYFSRHYRLRPGSKLPGLPTTRTVAGLSEFTVGILGRRQRAMQLAVVPLDRDHRFRTVSIPRCSLPRCGRCPPCPSGWRCSTPSPRSCPWPDCTTPLRRLVVGGAPVATGLHALGDSVCTTHPTLGRGLSLALWGAADLADTLDTHVDDWSAQALVGDRSQSPSASWMLLGGKSRRGGAATALPASLAGSSRQSAWSLTVAETTCTSWQRGQCGEPLQC
ncbi:MAG: hypothetical protein ACR2IK_19505 [Chloroflexota bacterium]